MGELTVIQQGLAKQMAIIQKTAPAWVKNPEAYASRVCSLAVTIWQENAYLQRCDQRSFLNAVKRCAEVGLEPNSPTQQAYIVPRDGKACLEIHGRGWAHMAMNQGLCVDFSVGVVHSSDDFEFSYEPDWTFRHTPYQAGGDPGEITHAYAIARLAGGGVRHYVLSRFELDKMAEKSNKIQKGNNLSWKENFEGMACAKAAKFFFKRRLQGLDPLMQRAVSYDDEAEIAPHELQEADVKVLSPEDILADTLGEAAPVPPKKKAPSKNLSPQAMLAAIQKASTTIHIEKIEAAFQKAGMMVDADDDSLLENPDKLKVVYEEIQKL